MIMPHCVVFSLWTPSKRKAQLLQYMKQHKASLPVLSWLYTELTLELLWTVYTILPLRDYRTENS